MTSDDEHGLAQTIGTNLPYLRRYARALTGSQDTGDRYAAAALEAILANDAEMQSSAGSKSALFAAPQSNA